MKIKNTIILAILLAFAFKSMAQIAINTDGSAPAGSAMVEVKSTTKGLLPPRMTTIQMTSISNPVAGLVVYNIDSSDYYGYNGTKWRPFWGNGGDFSPCGYSFTYEGKTYNTVLIGTQCWMKENLNVGTRIDGSGSPSNPSLIEKYCYNDQEDSCTVYGGLYTWAEIFFQESSAASGNIQGICPPGWHLPRDNEWKTLESYLGMSAVDVDKDGWRNSGSVGNQLKEVGTAHWTTPNQGSSNSSNFTAFGGGFLDGSNPHSFKNIKDDGYWWTNDDYGAKSVAYFRSLHYGNVGVNRDQYQKEDGLSVRCIRD